MADGGQLLPRGAFLPPADLAEAVAGVGVWAGVVVAVGDAVAVASTERLVTVRVAV
jgi:predicted RecA/RadA family phage recombinase